MSIAIESLENRTLFAGSTLAALAAEATLVADAGKLRSQLTSYLATYKADAAALKVDLATLPKTSANRRLEAAVLKDQAKVSAKFAAGQVKLTKSAEPAVKKAIAAGTALLTDPTRPAAQAKLRAAVAAVEAKGVAPLTAVVATLEAATTTLFADLSALAAANPTDAALAADVVTEQGHVTDARTTLMASFSQVAADAATMLAAL